MNEPNLTCPSCGLLLVGKNNHCIKCKKDYTMEDLFCPVCLTAKTAILTRPICSNLQCPSHKEHHQCPVLDCPRYNTCIHSLCMVFILWGNKSFCYVNLPDKCFVVRYNNGDTITEQELLTIMSFKKEYNIVFTTK